MGKPAVWSETGIYLPKEKHLPGFFHHPLRYTGQKLRAILQSVRNIVRMSCMKRQRIVKTKALYLLTWVKYWEDFNFLAHFKDDVWMLFIIWKRAQGTKEVRIRYLAMLSRPSTCSALIYILNLRPAKKCEPDFMLPWSLWPFLFYSERKNSD